MRHFINNHWGKIILAVILLVIIILNFKPGYFILGNDNYSPELNPKLSLERSLVSPAWRSYRVLGIPSDSEQADVFRSAAYFLLSFILPGWVLSQGYIFFCLITGSLSVAFLCSQMLSESAEKNKKEIMFLFAGFIYITNLLTIWFFFSPLNVFLAGYAFLPLVTWRIYRISQKNNIHNLLSLLFTLGIFTTSSMVATTFIVESGFIAIFIIFLFLRFRDRYDPKRLLLRLSMIFLLFLSSQLFWILPFISFVRSNSAALADSYINRVLTPELVENEIVYNQPQNITRFLFSWIDGKNNNGTYQYVYRSWYNNNLLAETISFIPTVFMLIGIFYIIKFKKYPYLFFPITLLTGWLLIKGTNPPFGFIFQFLQNNIPLFKQVFRWQSSKIYPFILIPLSFLASLGILYIIDKTEKQFGRKKSPVFRKIIISLVVLTGLIYVYPVFKGNLIGSKYYVKIPEDYFSLQSYLEQNRIRDRIYLAPEANTLYFRNYSWGFFGSSFMNYLIPNPVIEKALTTGSYENENAQNIIVNNYYSENPTIFANSLKMYNTPLVLLDKYAGSGENGYTYDWTISGNQIENNSSLVKVWEKGKLSLYKLKDTPQNTSYNPVNSNHDWKKFNTIISQNSKTENYYSGENESGDILPFALNFDSLSDNSLAIIGSSIYKGKDSQYRIDPPEYLSAPSLVSINKKNGSLRISPSLPGLSFNNNPVEFNLPYLNGNLDSATVFITIDGQVYDTSQPPFTEQTSYNQIKDRIYYWDENSTDSALSRSNGNKYVVKVTSDSVVKLLINITGNDIPVNICAYSVFQKRCLNRNNVYYLYGNKRIKLEMTIPEVINSFDTIEVYISGLNNRSDFEINSFQTRIYQTKNPITFSEIIPAQNYSKFVNLHPDDLITLNIPKIYGSNSYHFNNNDPFVPDVTHGDCGRSNTGYFLKKNADSTLSFDSKNCYDQSLVNFDRINPSGMAMIYYKGSNTSGIPLQISVRNKKESIKLFEDRLIYKGATEKMEYMRLPAATESYLLELYSYGFGPDTSINLLDNISFQFIPETWYLTKITPVQSVSAPLVEINESYHDNWTTTQSLKPVRINGWEQGWIVENGQIPEYEFKGNKMAYWGAAIFIAYSSLWLAWQIGHKLNSRKSSSRKHL